MRLRAGNLMVAFFVLSGSLAAQESPLPKSERAPSKDPCSIAGMVVKSGMSEPLKKAHIYLQKEDDQKTGYSAITDAAGHFAIQKIESGRYQLRVERMGYVSQSYGQDSSNSQGAILALDPARKLQDLVFRMAPWAVISGRITDEDGDPVPDMEVQAMRSYVSQGKRALTTEGYSETNDLGEFRLYGLAKGHYFIRAQVREGWHVPAAGSDSRDSGSTPETGYAPIYYPGTSDQARASALDVLPGQEIPSVDFTLIPVRTFRIRGRVFDATQGQPAKDCWVFVMPRDANRAGFTFGPNSQTNCAKGAFELTGVVPVSYYVEAMSRSSEKRHVARAPVEVGNANVDDVTLTFVAGVDLTGRTFVEGHEPADLSELRVWLEDRDAPFGSGEAAADIKTDGTLKLENVPEGHYQIAIRGEPPDFYLKSARADGEDILEKGLAIGAGTSRGPLEIVLSSAGARFEGTVTDENSLPCAGAVVALVPEGERRKQYHLYKNTTTVSSSCVVSRPAGISCFLGSKSKTTLGRMRIS